MSCSPASSHAFESSPRMSRLKGVFAAGGDRHVLCARVLEDSHPLLRVELRRIEPVHHASVGLGLDAVLLLIPFALGVVGVEPPVDEDPEALRGELVAGLEIPFFGRIVGIKRGCGEESDRGENGVFYHDSSLYIVDIRDSTIRRTSTTVFLYRKKLRFCSRGLSVSQSNALWMRSNVCAVVLDSSGSRDTTSRPPEPVCASRRR